MSQEVITVTRRGESSGWRRVLQTVRSFWRGPFGAGDRALASLFGGGPVAAGVTVNEATALNLSAVWAAVSMIAGDVASLPFPTYKRLPNGGRTRMQHHPLFAVLDSVANPEMTAMQARSTITASALLTGNGYAEIERDGMNRVRAIHPIESHRVTPFRDTDGVLRYSVANHAKPDIVLDAYQIFHLRSPISRDGIVGLSIIERARESIGLGLAAERFGGSFFGNGSTFGGILSVNSPQPLTEIQQKELRAGLDARHQGVDRAHKFLLLSGGVTYTKIGVSPNDAQFLETRLFQVAEIARWFGIPPTRLGDLSRATYSNSEQENLAYYQGCLRRWLTQWEQEVSLKLIAPSERSVMFAEHLIDAILRGDTATRYAAYFQGRQGGWLSVNDIRRMENLDPIEGGDTYLEPLNMTPAGSRSSSDDRALPPARVEVAVLPVNTDATPQRRTRRSSAVRCCGGGDGVYAKCDNWALEGSVFCEAHEAEHRPFTSDDPQVREQARRRASFKAMERKVEKLKREQQAEEDAQKQRVTQYVERVKTLATISAKYPGHADLLRAKGWPDHGDAEDEQRASIVVAMIRKQDSPILDLDALTGSIQ